MPGGILRCTVTVAVFPNMALSSALGPSMPNGDRSPVAAAPDAVAEAVSNNPKSRLFANAPFDPVANKLVALPATPLTVSCGECAKLFMSRLLRSKHRCSNVHSSVSSVSLCSWSILRGAFANARLTMSSGSQSQTVPIK